MPEKRNIYRIGFLALQVLICMVLLFSSCQRKRIVVAALPPNTPQGSPVYVAGSFNSWNPADPRYALQADGESGNWYVDLPWGFGIVQYKFTRGEWSNVETDSCSGEIMNRTWDLQTGEASINYISGWKDLEPVFCGKMVLVLEKLPENTPIGSRIFLSGNINYWSTGQKEFEFKPGPNGKYYLTLPRLVPVVQFKINRGSMESVEADENNEDKKYRELRFGDSDTAFIQLRNWLDLPDESLVDMVLCIKSVPAGTTPGSRFYAAGNFNFWNPHDNSFQFRQKGRRAYLNLRARKQELLQFKITRGAWDKVETNRNFGEIPDREVKVSGDTLYLDIENWLDFSPKDPKNKSPKAPDLAHQQVPNEQKPLVIPLPTGPPIAPENYFETDGFRKLTFIIEQVSDYTQEDEFIYLAGDFNNWNASDPQYRFKRISGGRYLFTLKLNDSRAHEYKITRGSWETEEADQHGRKMGNKRIPGGYSQDTLHLKIARWVDELPFRKLVIVLDQVPANTPPKDGIYLTGNFNNWQPADERYRFRRMESGNYVLVLKRFTRNYKQFKLTRGSWENQASNRRRQQAGNQNFGNPEDTLFIRIDAWLDLD